MRLQTGFGLPSAERQMESRGGTATLPSSSKLAVTTSVSGRKSEGGWAHVVLGPNYTGKRPQTVWGVGSQCTRYKQQKLWNSNGWGETWSQLQQQELLVCRSIERISQDHHTRMSEEHPKRIFIHAPMQSILMQGLLEGDFRTIPTGASHNDPYQIM